MKIKSKLNVQVKKLEKEKLFIHVLILKILIKMGQKMNKILPGLYLGSREDMLDREQINKNKITHILSIDDDEKVKLYKVKQVFYYIYLV